MLKVTLTKSTIGGTKSQTATVRGLGLRKIGHSRAVEDTPAVRGMLLKVAHLVRVDEMAE